MKPSSNLVLTTRNKPRRSVQGRRPEAVFGAPNSVRAYRDSPESVHLQIRLAGQYVGVSLTFAEANELGRHLIAETWFDDAEGN